MLFDNTEFDKKVYTEELKEFLPKKMIDIHVHVWKKEDRVVSKGPVSWASIVASENKMEDLIETYKIMFPDKDVKSLMFAITSKDTNSLAVMNNYVKENSSKFDFPALYFSHPNQTAEEVEKGILDGKFLGIKSYLSLANPSIPTNDVRIFDFFPHHQLELLNDMGGIVMCHIPRSLRFKDPANLEDIKEIATKYPKLKFIVAHIGRAYIPADMGNALEYLSECKNLLYDFSANTSDYAMEKTLESVGSKRLMFGSDLPISRMRMRRIEENGTYINIVPPKVYDNSSKDAHIRETTEEDAKNLTYFMYEEILAMKKATQKLNFGKEEIENLFFNNANELITEVRKNIYNK